MFERELEFFMAHQDELVAKYRDKFLVIRGEDVAGVYDSALDAFLDAQKRYEPGTYMIQHCEPGPEAYTVTIA